MKALKLGLSDVGTKKKKNVGLSWTLNLDILLLPTLYRVIDFIYPTRGVCIRNVFSVLFRRRGIQQVAEASE